MHRARSATVGTDPQFVAMLRDLVVERLAADGAALARRARHPRPLPRRLLPAAARAAGSVRRMSSSGGARPSSTRSTSARSPTATATGRATSRASAASCRTCVDLGVDAVWLTPFYPSPMADHGYDVADYCDVDPASATWPRSTGCSQTRTRSGCR
jgi:hypothetical protein